MQSDKPIEERLHLAKDYLVSVAEYDHAMTVRDTLDRLKHLRPALTQEQVEEICHIEYPTTSGTVWLDNWQRLYRILTRYAVQQASEDYCGSFAAQGIGALRARVEAAERERDLANRQYEGLRRIIDGASESMTHDDAVQELKVWRDDATALDRVKRERDAALARVKELEEYKRQASHAFGNYSPQTVMQMLGTAIEDRDKARVSVLHLAHRLAALEGKEKP